MLRRPSTFALTKSLLLLISHIPSLHSRPLGGGIELFKRDDGFPEEDPATAAFWWKFGVGLVLVLLGGVFAGISLVDEANLGLTLALLSQDEITVTPEEKKANGSCKFWKRAATLTNKSTPAKSCDY